MVLLLVFRGVTFSSGKSCISDVAAFVISERLYEVSRWRTTQLRPEPFMPPRQGIAKRLHAVEGFGHFRSGPSSVVLDPSSGEQEFTRIKDDRPSPRRQPTGSRDGLGKTRFGGFFVGRNKVLVEPGLFA